MRWLRWDGEQAPDKRVDPDEPEVFQGQIYPDLLMDQMATGRGGIGHQV